MHYWMVKLVKHNLLQILLLTFNITLIKTPTDRPTEISTDRRNRCTDSYSKENGIQIVKYI